MIFGRKEEIKRYKMEEKIEVKRLEEYIMQRDWRVKANANQGYSIGGAILNCAGGAQAQYWFDKVYGEEIADLHKYILLDQIQKLMDVMFTKQERRLANS